MELTQENYAALKYNIGTSHSVPVAYVLVLENHHSTMIILWGHGGSSNKYRERYKIIGNQLLGWSSLGHSLYHQ